MATVALPDTWVYALRLPHDPRAARVARATVRAALQGHGMGEALDVVELLTSELVTNAYRHTGGPASLRLTALGGGRLRVGVWDSHPHIPAPFGKPPRDRVVPAPTGADGGRGLFLVQEHADSWGGWPLGDDLLGRGAGKLLWFEVGGQWGRGPKSARLITGDDACAVTGLHGPGPCPAPASVPHAVRRIGFRGGGRDQARDASGGLWRR